jgi:hypothetical protein
MSGCEEVDVHILLWLLIVPIVLVICVTTAYRVPLPAALSGSRDLVAAISAGLLGMGYLLALAIYLLWLLRRSAQALDPVLEPLGLVGRGYAGFGRQYIGVLEGRAVEVRYFPAQAIRAARLDLVVEAQTGKRMAVGRRRPLLDCRDCPRLDLGEAVPYQVYAQDDLAARRWFADPEVRAALDRLMRAEGSPTLYVLPDRIWLRVQPWGVAGAEIEAWLWDLTCLID